MCTVEVFFLTSILHDMKGKGSILLHLLLVFNFTASLSFANKGKYSSVSEALANPETVTELWVTTDSDSLPMAISNCKNLHSIRFSKLNDKFDLNKALKIVSKLPKLKELHFWYLGSNEPPKNLQLLTQVHHIEFLYSASIDLEHYFEALKVLPKLNMLTLKSMSLTVIPENINGLKNLRYLNLSKNEKLNFSELFKTLAPMSIEELNLSSAKFISFPTDIIQLKDLRFLTLETIQGDFNTPESYQVMAQLNKLEYLNIEGNLFVSIDPSIALLQRLKQIKVDGNCLSDEEYTKLKGYLPNTEVQNKVPC